MKAPSKVTMLREALVLAGVLTAIWWGQQLRQERRWEDAEVICNIAVYGYAAYLAVRFNFQWGMSFWQQIFWKVLALVFFVLLGVVVATGLNGG